MSEIVSNLCDYSDESHSLSVDDVLEDNQLEIPERHFKGDKLLEPMSKYSADESAVYTFRAPGGLVLAGDKAMIDMHLPDQLPSIY